jgi:hypothetical protein
VGLVAVKLFKVPPGGLEGPTFKAQPLNLFRATCLPPDTSESLTNRSVVIMRAEPHHFATVSARSKGKKTGK